MANRSIVRDGLQELCVVGKQENLAEGNRAGKVVNVHQKQKEAQGFRELAFIGKIKFLRTFIHRRVIRTFT